MKVGKNSVGSHDMHVMYVETHSDNTLHMGTYHTAAVHMAPKAADALAQLCCALESTGGVLQHKAK